MSAKVEVIETPTRQSEEPLNNLVQISNLGKSYNRPEFNGKKYFPEIFIQNSIEGAKNIILTPEAEMTSEERWKKETPWIVEHLPLEESMFVLDYGCGIGRVAREFRNRDIGIVGVDISSTMREMANFYAGSPTFSAVGPSSFVRMAENGLRFDAAYSFWTLQHVIDPRNVAEGIAKSMKPQARFYLLNCWHRCVPVEGGWHDDGISVHDAVSEFFALVEDIPLPKDIFADNTFFHVYEFRG